MPADIITIKDWSALRAEAAYRAGMPEGSIYTGSVETPPDYVSASQIIEWPESWPVIPREEWPEMIKRLEGFTLSAIRGDKIAPHNQGRTSRCWAHGCTRAIEIMRIVEGKSPYLLSPDSVAYPIEGTRDRGGYPEDAAVQLAKGGACRLDLWPEQDLSPKRADPSWQSNALAHRLIKWIKVRTFAQQMTCAFRRLPVPIGLRWWGHLVCQLDPIQLGANEFGVGVDNSWGRNWKENGYGILDEESGTADLGAWCPVSTSWYFGV